MGIMIVNLLICIRRLVLVFHEFSVNEGYVSMKYEISGYLQMAVRPLPLPILAELSGRKNEAW